jgi:hypothetical protein
MLGMANGCRSDSILSRYRDEMVKRSDCLNLTKPITRVHRKHGGSMLVNAQLGTRVDLAQSNPFEVNPQARYTVGRTTVQIRIDQRVCEDACIVVGDASGGANLCDQTAKCLRSVSFRHM